jgi:hypothetical protein
MKYEPIDITCPRCGAVAAFHEPFEFVTTGAVDDDRPRHQWGGWTVIELFPSMFRWKAPGASAHYLRHGGGQGGGYPVLTYGLLQCSSCHVAARHRLRWPDDAYWKWQIRGNVLWAWDRKHATAILRFVSAKIRPARISPRLRHIPTVFLTAANRDEVVRKIRARLPRESP